MNPDPYVSQKQPLAMRDFWLFDCQQPTHKSHLTHISERQHTQVKRPVDYSETTDTPSHCGKVNINGNHKIYLNFQKIKKVQIILKIII